MSRRTKHEPLDEHNDGDDLDDTVADVELDEALDSFADEAVEEDDDDGPVSASETIRAATRRGRPAAAGDSADYDPEAGVSHIADKTSLSTQLTGETGMFVLSLLVLFGAVVVAIQAAVFRTIPWLIACGVTLPPACIWAWARFKRWRRGDTYVSRTLTTFGEHEEAEAIRLRHLEKQKLKAEERIRKLEAQQRAGGARDR